MAKNASTEEFNRKSLTCSGRQVAALGRSCSSICGGRLTAILTFTVTSGRRAT